MSCKVCNGPVRSDRHSEYCSKKCQATVEGYCEPWEKKLREEVQGTTAWRPMDLEPTIDIMCQKILIVSDVHCPIHSVEWLYQAVRVGLHYGCTQVLINGDFVDCTPISSHKGSNFSRKNVLDDDLAAAESVLKILCTNFEKVYLLSGNHDTRLIKAFGGEVSPQRLFKMLGSFDNFKTTGRYYAHLNRSWKFVHPRQYSKIRGKLAQDLAQRWQMNIATGHQHHSARTISVCGKFQCVDIGALVDIDAQDYVNYDANTFAAPVNGFAILNGDDLMLFDKFTPWKLLGLPGLRD